MKLDEVVGKAESQGLASAAALFRFADEILWNDIEGRCGWVVLRAIDRAEKEIRDAVDEGDDLQVVQSKVSAIRLRLGIEGIREILNAGPLADDAIEDRGGMDAMGRASQILREAAKRCYGLAFQAADAK
jgi:hypothetical protein